MLALFVTINDRLAKIGASKHETRRATINLKSFSFRTLELSGPKVVACLRLQSKPEEERLLILRT